MYVVGIVVMSLWGLAGPSLQGLMTRLVAPTEQGQLQGANSSILGISNLIGPILFAQIFASAIVAHVEWHAPGAPFFLSAALVTQRSSSRSAYSRRDSGKSRPSTQQCDHRSRGERLIWSIGRSASHRSGAFSHRAATENRNLVRPRHVARHMHYQHRTRESAGYSGFNLLTTVVDYPPEPSRMQACVM